MKLHVNADGSFDVDIVDGEEKSAVALIRQLQAPDKDKSSKDGPVSLNEYNYETWAWLVENDCEEGVHFTAMAREMGITVKEAHNRVYRLKDKGYADIVGKGRYRAKS